MDTTSKRLAAGALGGLAAVTVLSGCGTEGHTTGGDCTSRYLPVARADTLAALKDELVAVRPSARSLRVVGHEDDKRTVNVLNRRERVVIQVDVWKLPNGSWTARQWSQCID